MGKFVMGLFAKQNEQILENMYRLPFSNGCGVPMKIMENDSEMSL